jgi:hypothetical protein
MEREAVRPRRPKKHRISLDALGKLPVIPEEAVGFYKQNCMVCFYHNGHSSGVRLRVQYESSNETIPVFWSGDVTDQLLRAYADLIQATNFGACTIALLLIRELMEFTAIEQAIRGTTIDYYLAPQDQDEVLIFNRAARLEVSGILKESENNTVDARVKKKLRRLKQKGDLPTFIIIVEFSQPWSNMVEA